MPRALIIGATSQDGALLADFLLKKGYEVWGLYRRTSNPNFWRLRWLGIFDKVRLIQGDIADTSSLLEVLSKSKPDEVYNLAAQSFVEASFRQPLTTAQITGLGVLGLLEVVRVYCPDVKVYQAGSSEMFGRNSGHPLNEDSPMAPSSPYAGAKLFAHHMVRVYREAYGLFAVDGILHNHESTLRGLEFVTRKVTNAAAMIRWGKAAFVELGDLSAERDWGHAKEYVEAMWLMLQQKEPRDYVIATGAHHSVKELCELAFGCLDLDWQAHVVVDDRLFRPLDVPLLVGDASKAKRELGWSSTTTFEELITEMALTDLDRWARAMKGEIIPWDIR